MAIMKTVRMTFEKDLIALVDQAAKKLGTTRSGFTRQALRAALKEIHIRQLEQKHRDGYKRKPIKRGEFSLWEPEQLC